MMILSRRVPSRFCTSISSSTCLRKSRPSSTRASAMRSPKVLIGGIELAESLFQRFHDFGRRGQVPEQTLFGGLLQVDGGRAVERVGSGDHDRFAQAIKRKHTPALAGFHRKSAGKLDIQIVLIERQKTDL